MRSDMAKVVTEAPRRGHANPSRKWGRRLRKNEYELDDHGPARASSARRRQYDDPKDFSDVLGPLRRYLRKQVGRPWNKIWSEITQTLDSRSLTGLHIFDHIRWEVEEKAWIGEDGRVYRKRQWGAVVPVDGLYVHPLSGLLRSAPDGRFRFRGGPLLDAQAALRAFGLSAANAEDIRRYRVDGMRVWERRDCGWFIHTYWCVPEQLMRVLTRSDGSEFPIYSTPRLERVAMKQASKKEIRDALPLLRRDPLGRTIRA
jgi:hypothetical protein